jgi:hypothetical protein
VLIVVVVEHSLHQLMATDLDSMRGEKNGYRLSKREAEPLASMQLKRAGLGGRRGDGGVLRIAALRGRGVRPLDH